MEEGQVDPLVMTNEGFTALHLACSMAQQKVAKYMILEAGVPVDCTNAVNTKREMKSLLFDLGILSGVVSALLFRVLPPTACAVP